MELYVDLTIQFFEGGDAFRTTHTLSQPNVTVKEEDIEYDDYLAELLEAHFSKEISDIIAQKYDGAGYSVTGIDYDDGYVSLRIDIEE